VTITYRVYDSYKVRPVVDALNRRREVEEFPLVVGDTLPYLDFSLIDEDENPYDLTGHTVKFYFKKYGLGYHSNSSTECDIVEAVSGTCRYSWSEGDIEEPGLHVGELELTTQDHKKLSMPYVVRFRVRDQLEQT